MTRRQWLPWAGVALAALVLEMVGFLDASGRNWTLSRVIRWVDAHKVRLGVPVAAAMVVLWLHWFAFGKAVARRFRRHDPE